MSRPALPSLPLRRLTRRRMLFALAAVAPLELGCSSLMRSSAPKVVRPTPTPMPKPPTELTLLNVPAASATAVPSGTWRFTVLQSGRAKALKREGFVALEADAGRAWVVALVRVDNVGKAPSALPLDKIVAVDAKAKRYPLTAPAAEHYAVANNLASPSDALKAGGQTILAFVFDVPETAGGFKLHFVDAKREVPLGI